MGVVNVTPDSFSDGGHFAEPGIAVAHGLRLHAEGADIVDVGGEVDAARGRGHAADEEIRRVIPVVEGLARAGVLVSIDTRRAVVMRAAIAAGARMINDISALRHDPESLAAAGASGVPVVLMHSQGEPATMQVQPTYDRAALDVFDHLNARVQAWTDAGFERSRLLIDPGIGFGKTAEHNLEILSQLGLYLGMGLPVLVGVSRKSFIGRIAGGAPPLERLPGSLAAALGAAWLPALPCCGSMMLLPRNRRWPCGKPSSARLPLKAALRYHGSGCDLRPRCGRLAITVQGEGNR